MNHPTHRVATTLLAPALLAALLLTACTSDSDTPDPTTTPSPTDPSPTTTATPPGPAPVPPGPPPGGTATPPPTPDTRPTVPAPPPRDLPPLPPDLASSPPDTWQRHDLSPGDEVPDLFGIFIADASSGSGTLWSLNPESVDDPRSFFSLRTSPESSYIVTRGQPNHLVNTSSTASFTWRDQAELVLIDDHGLALFRAIQQGCQFWVLDLAGAEPIPVSTIAWPEFSFCGSIATSFSPDRTQLLIAFQGAGTDGGSPLYTANLTTGATQFVANLNSRSITLNQRASDDEAAFFTASLPGVAWIASYNWTTGDVITTLIETVALSRSENRGPPSPDHLRLSPDGRWVAWSDRDNLGTGQGLGGVDEWPVVVIASVEDTSPVVRAQRVALTTGIVTFDWLADSSALVVQSEDGFALLAPDGTIEDLPFPVAFHFDPVPIPAPDSTDRYAYDGRVVDASGNERAPVPAVADVWGTATESRGWRWWTGDSYAWNATADRLIFIREAPPQTDFGRGGIATLGLPPRITTGPAAARTSEPIRLRVTSDGDNVNVRAAPGLAAEPIGKFPHGTLITLTRDTTIEHCGPLGCSILNDPDLPYGTSWWLYVRDEAGLEGWVTSEFVEWAD